MIWALGIAALLAGLWTGFVFFANGMRSGSGKFVGAGTIWAAWLVVLILLVLLVAPAKAHDHSKPHLNDWLKSLHSKSKVWCCDGKDYDPIDDWETKDGGYRVKFRGQWFDVPEGAIIDGSNKAGDALLWMNKGYGGLSVRCFMPGAMT